MNQLKLASQITASTITIAARKKERIIKPTSSGKMQSLLVVGGGLATMYTFWATMPIAAIAALIAMGLHFKQEIDTFQSPQRSEALKLLWEANTVRHPSLKESIKEIKAKYPTDAINRAIEQMVDECEWFVFSPDQSHELAPFGEVYCWQDGVDEQVMLPTAGLHKLMKRWGLTETVETKVLPYEALPESLPFLDTITTDFNPPSEQPIEAIEEAPKDALAFLRSLTTAPLQPVIIAGLPGSGKGILAAIALTMGVKESVLKYWVFNPKNQLKEAGYWSFAEQHYLKNRLLNDADLFIDLMTVLEEFATEGSRRNETAGDHAPFVLLLEEIGAIVSLFDAKEKQLFKAKVIALASLLRSSNMAVWFSGQSVNLEDLGISGKSNRAIFTSIVAVGSDRESARQLCSQLELPFDTSEMGTGRYWITSAGNYPAVQAPKIPTYSSWAEVPNVIDLRPAVEEIEETLVYPVEEIALPTQIHPVEYQLTAKEKLEDTFKLNSAELTQINEVEAIPDPIDLLLLNYANDPKTASFLKWVSAKPDGEIFTKGDVQGSYWAKKNGRDKETMEVALVEAINNFLLIEIDGETYQKKGH